MGFGLKKPEDRKEKFYRDLTDSDKIREELKRVNRELEKSIGSIDPNRKNLEERRKELLPKVCVYL